MLWADEWSSFFSEVTFDAHKQRYTLCHCSSLARARDRPQPFPMSMCVIGALSVCLTCA